MDDETIKIQFQGEARVSVFGKMEIPKNMWDARAEDENWSDDIEKYILDRVEGEHFDHGMSDDIELDDVRLAGAPSSG